VIASSSRPLSLAEAVAVWRSSRRRSEVLEHRWTHFGFATSARPSRSGQYYAVMIVEER